MGLYKKGVVAIFLPDPGEESRGNSLSGFLQNIFYAQSICPIFKIAL